MQFARIIILAAFLLIIRGDIADAATSPSSGTIACDRVALGSRSSTKWTVSCISNDTATASSAYFNPSLVSNYYVSSGEYVAPSSSDLNLSSTFSEVDTLVSTSVTKFSLAAASGYTPTMPVTIVSTAFSELSALQTLYLADIPLAGDKLHLVLPTSIQKISILNCGLSNLSFEFADGSAIADSAISSIDLRHNALDGVPTSLYSLPTTVSTIDLRGNDFLSFASENSAHKKKLTTWIDDKVLHASNTAVMTLSSSQVERSSPKTGSKETGSNSDIQLPTSSSGSQTVTSAQHGSDMGAIPVTIIAVVVPAVLALGIALAFVIRKRRRMQDRETDAILELPHPFDKASRDRSETSGNFTLADSELSRSRMSIGDSHYHEDRDSCVILAVTPTGGESTQQLDTSTSFNAGYVNLESPLDSHHSFAPTNKKRQISRREDRDSSRSLELLGTLSTASTTPAQTRLASRKTLRLALETLVKTKPNHEGAKTPALLTINTHQYSFSPGTQIEETPLALFIDCRLSTSPEESSMAAPPSKLVLKIFIEDDADLAGRESYALSCLQHDKSTRVFAPRVHDVALEYELVPKANNDAVKLNCCILVLEMPSCTTLRSLVATSREPTLQQISRVANAVQALHSRGLIHGALHTESLVACSPDARLKFWGLENVSRAGHTVPSPDTDVLKAFQAECVAPELASVALEETLSIRASPSLDVWSLGVMILKLYASGRPLEEFKGCSTPREVFERINASALDEQQLNTCFFERSIAQFVPDTDMEDVLRRCLHSAPNFRPSIYTIANHSLFQSKEREVCRPITVKSAVVSRMLSAIIEEKDLTTSGEPERETSGTEQLPEKIEDMVSEPVTTDEIVPEPLPPSLWLFLPPVELEIDLTQRTSFYSVEQWVSRLKHLKQQRGGELRFPLVFMCESHTTVQCSVTTTSKHGSTVTESLLCLVMPLVRETMLFLEARAILSNGLSVGEVSGLVGPQQWEELQSFYCALERMELATLNPVNEMELAPLQKQLKTRDPSKAQQVLDHLTQLIFSEEKREYVRNLLNALESDEAFATRVERSSWATLRRCEITGANSSTLRRTRWLCSHHAPQEN